MLGSNLDLSDLVLDILQNVYRMLLGDLCTYVIINISNITVYLMLLLLTVFRIKDMFKII